MRVGTVGATTTACEEVGAGDTPTFLQVIAPAKVVDAGTCAMDGGALVSPEPWGQEVRLCAALAGKGCNEGKACVANQPPGFKELTCITQAGTTACPAGWTSQSLQLYGGGTDSRACSPCTCDTSMVGCDGGAYTANASDNCSVASGTTPISIGASNSCVGISGLANKNNLTISLAPELGTLGGLTCGTSIASGMVATMGSLELCCRPIFQ
jgi:hypothetical protein